MLAIGKIIPDNRALGNIVASNAGQHRGALGRSARRHQNSSASDTSV